jgi:predicted kinase/HD superfamily phosphodiesterase
MKYKTLQDNVGNTSYDVFPTLFPKLSELATTPQDKVYHAEGDVWTHTKMVCDALLSDEYYQNNTPTNKFIMWYSALLHDISKPACTKIEDTGRISSAGHSKRGAIDTRILLWKMNIPIEIRESIVNIIATHQVPFFAFADKPKDGKPLRTPEYIANSLSWQLPLDLLITVAKADMNGRTFYDKANSLADIELFREIALEQDCFNKPKQFYDDNTRMEYFASTGGISPDYKFHKDIGSEVIVLSGLPAVGKNTWCEKNCKGLEILSFDDAKEELGLSHGDNVGKAVHMVTDRAKELLRTKTPFAWNATHLSLQMRNKTLDLLYRYNAKVRLVYLEAEESVIKSRNSKRDTTLPNSKIDSMLYKWEVPTRMEAHQVDYVRN